VSAVVLPGPRRLSGLGANTCAGHPVDNETVTLRQTGAPGLARWQFNGRQRAQRAGDAPRGEVLDDLHHASIFGNEDGINREAHPEGVNRVARREDERLIVLQTVAAEESLASASRIKRSLYVMRNGNSGTVVDEHASSSAACDQRTEETHGICRARRSSRRDAGGGPTGMVKGGSGGRSPETRPDRKSRKFTEQSCVDRKLRNRL